MPFVRNTTAVLLVFGMASPALADLCRIDPKRANYGPKASVGGALICDGKNLDGMWATISNNEIVGLSWRHRDGKKERAIQVHSTGELFFLMHDDNIQGTFSTKSRAVSRHVFPRDKKILVESNGKGIITVHDSAGNEWRLAVTPWKQHDQSFEIVAINGKKQVNKPMDHTAPGIVGVDIAAFGPLVLIKNEPSMHSFADRRTPQYHKTKSVFVDAKGTRCEVENKLLFGPAPHDPNDKFENAFVFAEDRTLRQFLAKQCPQLDVSVLPQP
jgi:hypothetical protein